MTMPNREYEELKASLAEQGKKIDRLLSWAEGDPALGTPSIKQQMRNIEKEVVENRKRTYENRLAISGIQRDITNLRKTSGAAGVGGGGIVVGVIEFIKSYLN